MYVAEEFIAGAQPYEGQALMQPQAMSYDTSVNEEMMALAEDAIRLVV